MTLAPTAGMPYQRAVSIREVLCFSRSWVNHALCGQAHPGREGVEHCVELEGALDMRLRALIAVGAVSAVALVGGSMAAFATGPDGEHGHGFNCTPGNPGNAEFQHESRGKEDHGNGEDCLESVTPITPVTPLTPSAQPSTAVAQQGATAAAARPAAQPPTSVVRAQPRVTG